MTDPTSEPRWRRFLRDLRQLRHAIWSDAPDRSYEQLLRSERLYRVLAENARDIIWMLDFPSHTTYVSPACERILGVDPDVQLSRQGGFKMLSEESAEHAQRLLEDAIARRAPSLTFEAEHRRADGSTVWCEVHQAILYDDRGTPVSSVGVTRDISEKRALQEQLVQAQKAEAIGTLAGGVAHDFNNFLTVIIGSLELASEQSEKDDAITPLLVDALDAAERATALTGQLLAFSRHQPVTIGAIDVNAVVRQDEGLLRRMLGERNQLELRLGRGLRPARADENQIHQVILNLAVNARDALGEGGSVRVETAEVFIDRELAEGRPGMVAGPHVMIAVSDDGHGMDEEVRSRATEPFFSTKEKGRGTGLGLAMVRSILERIGGDLSLTSEPGVGTTVKVFLQAAADHDVRTPLVPSPAVAALLRGSETVLVVDDEDTVRGIACQILRHAGYDAHGAAGSDRALEAFQELADAGRPPDLVMTDLVMPGLNGVELAERIHRMHPATRFVIMSGYAENGTSQLSRDAMPGPLLSKPFHAHGLLKAVRTALD